MANITIRNLDDDIRTRLRVRAAGNGHSMEEEVRQILRKAVGRAGRSRDLTSIIRSHFGPANGVDLELPPRESGREPPSFE
ncbi:FitA-like ribbon-helix-helix domain-containing protein [Candidatus Palauibacter sp.]|uniref:FitA-like ribbon-helix-helix domain-containing protein n=1 Tax=Candidatus Palauibacter sp. TaxID=3101350 RepID=UPI003AF2C275